MSRIIHIAAPIRGGLVCKEQLPVNYDKATYFFFSEMIVKPDLLARCHGVFCSGCLTKESKFNLAFAALLSEFAISLTEMDI